MSRYLGATFGSLGSVLGSFEAISGALEGILGGLGGLLGSSWMVLGWSWGVLGCSWGGPGAVLGGLVAIFKRHLEQSNFWLFFWWILVAKRVSKGRHFGSENGIKIDPKTRSKFKSQKVASWDRLGSILGRFGRCPGGIFIDFLLVFVLFRGNRRFPCEIGPKTVWRRNLDENDAKLGAQNDPKSIQNRYRKLIKF